MSAPILFVSEDIFFWSRVHGVAKSLGRDIQRIGDESAMEAAFSAGGVSRVIADLGCKRVDVVGWGPRWKRVSPPPTLIAFGSHVDEAGMTAARSAGYDHVVPNSRFHRSIAEWLA